jgi:tetraacyldisaccharide 4'-kinase
VISAAVGPLARALERGRLRSPLALLTARIWAARAAASRPLALPRGAAVIGVGGATLGGSHKTTLTLALAAALRERGERVAVVAHGYRARVASAREAHPRDAAQVIGDDAAWLARELVPAGVPVYVGDRGHALELAARRAPVVIVDSLLQAHPERLALSLLAVDGVAPWGACACPPAGDLRARRDALLDATDAVVAVSPDEPAPVSSPGRPQFRVRAELYASAADGAAIALDSIKGVRAGVVLAIARPDRFVRSLAARGIEPVAMRLFADHSVPRACRSRRGAPPVDLWLTTPKCATKLGEHYEGAPLAVVRQRLFLPDVLLAMVRVARG